ncbi:alkaline phosphatase family protein [Polaromonas sp.]|uniref:alkaline phosphatase family protein n=1 Tax=Polaromonas sp. TaxID=1869339 RepID=UPI002FC7FA66
MIATVLAACAAVPESAPKPKLVVFLVVDGLPQRQITSYRDQLAPDGLARFLDRGAWFADAHYGHAFTVTAAGHATMLTGAYPHRTGIIGNDWRDVNTGAAVYNSGDTSATYIGHKTNALDGTSPRNLKAETVGDVLRRVDARSKVIAISGKDRGAILPAGKSGTAYMYMGASGQFASSTYYMKEHPAWVNAFNARKPADRYFKTEWKPLLPEAAYARSIPDGQPWFGPRGGKLPMMMGVADDDAPGPAFYTALLRSPFGDALSLDFARAAIAGEQLGQDDAPDVLSVSLSGHDYVNHAYSAESRISHDHLLQLDRLFQAFFRDLDSAVGKDNYLVVLTADHGFMPAPEHSQVQGQVAGRLSGTQALGRMNAQLERSFGVDKLVPFISASALVLDRQLIARRGLNFDTVADFARTMLVADPAIAAAYTRRELETGSRAGEPFFEQMRKSWHKNVSGDVQYVLKPLWMMSSSSSITTHGSPHPYDTNVPILVYGPKWVKPGRIDSRVEVVDIAPTLARLLGVPAPSAAEGKLLPLAVP